MPRKLQQHRQQQRYWASPSACWLTASRSYLGNSPALVEPNQEHPAASHEVALLELLAAGAAGGPCGPAAFPVPQGPAQWRSGCYGTCGAKSQGPAAQRAAKTPPLGCLHHGLGIRGHGCAVRAASGKTDNWRHCDTAFSSGSNTGCTCQLRGGPTPRMGGGCLSSALPQAVPMSLV